MIFEVLQQEPRFREVLVLVFGDHVNLVGLDHALEHRGAGLVRQIDQHVFVALDQVAEQRCDQVDFLLVAGELEIEPVVTERMVRQQALQVQAVRDGHAACSAKGACLPAVR